MKRALPLAAVALAACYDFRGRFEECRDAGRCIDDVAPARLEVTNVVPDFGTVEVGSASQSTRVMTVRNAGEQSSGLLSITVDGGSGAFLVQQEGCVGARLDPAGECDVKVIFVASAPGDSSAQLFASAEPGGSVFGSTLAHAVAPAQIGIAPGNHNFLKVTIGQDSAPTRFTLTNQGTGASGPLTLTTEPQFPFTTTCATSTGLAPGSACDVDVLFRATAPPATSQGSLTVAWGNGRMAAAQLTGESVNPSSLMISPNVQPYGDVNTGSVLEHTFTIRAGDANPTGALSVALSDAGSPWFTIVGGDCGAAGVTQTATCDVRVRFSPQSFQAVTTNLEVTGTLAGTALASLSGRGIDLVTLQVTSDGGDGAGRLVTDGGLDCGAACTQQLRRFTPVQLVAVPQPLNELTSWSGACAAAAMRGASTCDLVASTDLTAGATFSAYRNLQITTGNGSITVAPTGQSCATDCVLKIAPSVVATVTPIPTDPFFAFTGWSGCAFDGGPCEVAMTQDRAVVANYSPYNRVFVTSSAIPAGALRPPPSMTDNGPAAMAAGHAFCQAHAVDAGLPGTYKAWISMKAGGLGYDATNPFTGLDTGNFNGWVRTDGRPIGPSFAPTWYPIRLDERGRDVGSVPVATGTGPDGKWSQRTNNHCGQFGVADAGGFVDYGLTSTLEPLWTDADAGSSYTFMPLVPCSAPVHFYCYGANTKNVTRPPAAPPGARRAFLSRSSVMGSVSQASAGQTCQNDATAAGLTGTFVAFRATTAASAASAVSPLTGAGWYRTDGVQLFVNATDVSTMAPLTTLDVLPDAGRLPLGTEDAELVFTGGGSPTSPQAAVNTCNNWSDNMGNARFGAAVDSTRWFWNGSDAGTFSFECGNGAIVSRPRRIYCFER